MDTQASRRRDPGIAATWLLLAILALALRLPDIGNPLIDLDEQFYLLVGDRMLHGAIPYVDIWDRKPVGLFLIYAAARALGGDPWIGYQLAATAAATLTAGIIAVLARRLATNWAGLCAGAVYLVWIELLGGRGGQAPIFYDGLIAGAALLTWLAIDQSDTRWRNGVAALLLVGLALQIKPTVVFEGAWFGVALLIGAWRRGVRPGALTGYALTLIGIALVPTLVAYAAYLRIGHGEAWWFANVESIFLRTTAPGEPIAGRLIGIALNLLIPAGAACFGLTRVTGVARWVIGGWLLVAMVGLLAVPPYFNHYALPLVVPIAVLAGIAMATSRPFAILVGIAAAALLLLSGYPHRGDRHAARHQVAALAATIDRYRGDGCLFAFSAPPVLYQATRSCLPTRYPFGTHLTLTSEAHAIGVDPIAELRRILATHPPVIVSGPPVGSVERLPYRLVAAQLARDYVAVGRGLGSTVYALRRRPADNP